MIAYVISDQVNSLVIWTLTIMNKTKIIVANIKQILKLFIFYFHLKYFLNLETKLFNEHITFNFKLFLIVLSIIFYAQSILSYILTK